ALHAWTTLLSCVKVSFHDRPAPTIATLSLHDALPIWICGLACGSASSTANSRETTRSMLPSTGMVSRSTATSSAWSRGCSRWRRSEEHTSELQSRENLVCRLLLEKKKINNMTHTVTSL